MRHLLLVTVLILAACGGADKNKTSALTAEVHGPGPMDLEGRELHEAACDRALDLLAAAPDALEGYSLAELRGECMKDLSDALPGEARRLARCYVHAADMTDLAVCADPETSAYPSEPQDSPAAVVPHALADPTGVDPLTWRVCVHLAEVAMVELAAQMDMGQVAEIKDMAVQACVDALKTVPQHELEMVSDCLLEAKTIDGMKGCNLPGGGD
jgi:hypothetical protein